MTSSIRSFLDWCSHTATIVYIRDSSYGMPAVQSVHLVALTMLLAAMLVLNLRLAAVSMMDWSLPAVERQLRPWAIGALTLVVGSGTLSKVTVNRGRKPMVSEPSSDDQKNP